MIGAYHHAVVDTVGRFQGFVAKHVGDGVLIYFGYPRAQQIGGLFDLEDLGPAGTYRPVTR